MTSPVVNPGNSTNLRKACDACHAAKVRCVPSVQGPGSPCQRCVRLAITCKFSPPETGSKRKRKRITSRSTSRSPDNSAGASVNPVADDSSLFNNVPTLPSVYSSLDTIETENIFYNPDATQRLRDDDCFRDFPELESLEQLWPTLPIPSSSSLETDPIYSHADELFTQPPIPHFHPAIRSSDPNPQRNDSTAFQSQSVNASHLTRLTQALATMQSDSCSILKVGEALQVLVSVAEVITTMGSQTPECSRDFDRPSLVMLMFSTAYMALGVHHKFLAAGVTTHLEGLSGFGATFSPAETTQIRNALLSGQLRTLQVVAELIRGGAEKWHHGPELCIVQEMARRLYTMIDTEEKRLKELVAV